MDAMTMEADDSAAHHHERDVAVAVITTVGIYPGEEDYRRVPDSEVIKAVLDAADRKLKLTNTSDWVARVRHREINVRRTFREEGLKGIVEIEWHKPEGGGGA